MDKWLLNRNIRQVLQVLSFWHPWPRAQLCCRWIEGGVHLYLTIGLSNVRWIWQSNNQAQSFRKCSFNNLETVLAACDQSPPHLLSLIVLLLHLLLWQPRLRKSYSRQKNCFSLHYFIQDYPQPTFKIWLGILIFKIWVINNLNDPHLVQMGLVQMTPQSKWG